MTLQHGIRVTDESDRSAHVLVSRKVFERSLRQFVAMGSGLPGMRVIPGNDKVGPSPKMLYSTVLLVSAMNDGMPSEMYRGDDETQLVRYVQSATYSVQWYRDGARAAGDRFKAWAESTAGVTESERLGFRYMGCGDIRQIDDIVSDAYEERCGVDIEVVYWYDLQYPVLHVREVTVTRDVDGDSGTNTIDATA